MSSSDVPLVTPAVAKPRLASVPTPALAGSPPSESFRLLALNVEHLLEGSERRSVLIMSAFPRDGRTAAAVGLAHALAELGAGVLVLDADPVGTASDRAVAIPSLQYAAPAKLAPTSQSALVTKVCELLRAAEAERLTTVIDTPPSTISSLAFQLAPHVGGILYVARRSQKDTAVHADVRSQLDLLGARVLGIVFNEI